MEIDRPRREHLSDHSDVLAAAMVIFATVYRESITPQLSEIYLKALGDLTVKDFKDAVNHVVKTSKYFPKPADIREAVDSFQRQEDWERPFWSSPPSTPNRDFRLVVNIEGKPYVYDSTGLTPMKN